MEEDENVCADSGSVSTGVFPPGGAFLWLGTIDMGSASRQAIPTVGGGCGLKLAAMVAPSRQVGNEGKCCQKFGNSYEECVGPAKERR